MAKKSYIDQNTFIGSELYLSKASESIRKNDENMADVFDPSGASEEIIPEAIDNSQLNCIHWE